MRALLTIVSAALLASALPTLASAQLPDGPGRDALERNCASCHQADIVTSLRLTRSGWEDVIADMISRGAAPAENDRAAIVDYLATHFAPAPLDINAATVADLERVLELTKDEADALIAARDRAKGFASLEDLKDIERVPFEKIEAKKDRITFGKRPAA